ADLSMELFGIYAGNNTVTLLPLTPGTQIDIGGADGLTGSPLTLGLTDAELDRITAGTVRIGDPASGAISITDEISPQDYTTLAIGNGAGFSATGGFAADVVSATVFERMTVDGPLVIDPNATLSVSVQGAFVPDAGDDFTLIENTSTSATSGAFAGKPEG